MSHDHSTSRPWILVIISLASGGRLEVRVPGGLGGSLSTYEPAPGETGSITLCRRNGKVIKGKLDRLLKEDE